MPLTNCPNCNSKLDPEEITAGECWACREKLPAEPVEPPVSDERFD